MYRYMLFLGHLVIGLIIGFILYEFFHDQTIIIFVAIGSVLPDVIDKPLGHIIFGSTLDNGKIFFHSFIIVLLFFVTGLIIWKFYKSNSFILVACGMFLHQLVDMMWKRPVNWYYPFLGPYQTEAHNDYFLNAIVAELTFCHRVDIFHCDTCDCVSALHQYKTEETGGGMGSSPPGKIPTILWQSSSSCTLRTGIISDYYLSLGSFFLIIEK